MGEVVDLIEEEAMPELDVVLSLMFVKNEVQAITSLRDKLARTMKRKPKSTQDLYKYIQFEMKVVRIIKIRQQTKGLQCVERITNMVQNLKDGISKLFIEYIRISPENLKLWRSYISFCEVHKLPGETGVVISKFLREHGGIHPQIYKVAADFELQREHLDEARTLLVHGLIAHKHCALLLKDAFKLELVEEALKRKAPVGDAQSVDELDPELRTRKAELVYDSSIKDLNNLELMNDLMNICDQFDFASPLLAKIYQDVYLNQDNERMWVIIAGRELKKRASGSISKNKIERAVAMYETAVSQINTTTMWSRYLDAVLEVNKDTSTLPNFKRNLLFGTFKKALAAGKLTEPYFLILVSLLRALDKHKVIIEMLEDGLKQPHLRHSEELWRSLLQSILYHGQEKKATQVFDECAVILGPNSLTIWKLMLQYEHTKRNSSKKIDAFYRKSWNAPPEICAVMKPDYLEWLTLTDGIAKARKMYFTMLELNCPPCLEIHTKMIYLENVQPYLSAKRVRKYHMLACEQFGDSQVGVWIDFVKFENSQGDKDKLVEIYWSARNKLPPHLIEPFLSEFGLIHSLSSLNNSYVMNVGNG